MLRLNKDYLKHYLLIAGGLLALEVCIALYVHDRLIRPYVGDVLATVLLYCVARSVVITHRYYTLAAVLGFSYLIEGLQYVHLLNQLGWQHSRVARIVLGSCFEWSDMLAYTVGALAVLFFEHLASLGSPTVRAGYGASRPA